MNHYHVRCLNFLVTLALLFTVKRCSAQAGADSVVTVSRTDDYAPFADFHIHTSFKNYYRYVKDPDSTISYANDPEYLQKRYGSTNWIPFAPKRGAKRKGVESNMANYDQGDYATLAGLGGSVLCMSITPPEKVI